MGYTTDFRGSMKIVPPLPAHLVSFINKLSETRRMKRNLTGFGIEGEFYVDGGGMAGQDHEDSVVEYNYPPKTQPSLWCQWVVSEDGTTLQWDGGEKFYSYVDWMQYLMETILMPSGHLLVGTIKWVGADAFSDRGEIVAQGDSLKASTHQITLIPNTRFVEYMLSTQNSITPEDMQYARWQIEACVEGNATETIVSLLTDEQIRQLVADWKENADANTF